MPLPAAACPSARRRLEWLIIGPPRTATMLGLGGKKKGGPARTKCEKCGAELYYPERLERHMKKAHGNVPAKKPSAQSGDGGLW